MIGAGSCDVDPAYIVVRVTSTRVQSVDVHAVYLHMNKDSGQKHSITR